MRFVNLQRIGNIGVCRRKSRADVWPARVQSCPIEVPIEPVLREIFVNSRIPLQTVPVTGGVEHSVINHGGATREIGRGCGSTSSWKDIRGSLRDTRYGATGRRIVFQQTRTQCVRKILLGP